MKIDDLEQAAALAKKYQAGLRTLEYMRTRKDPDDVFSLRLAINDSSGSTFKIDKETALDLFDEMLTTLGTDLIEMGVKLTEEDFGCLLDGTEDKEKE